MATAQRVSAAMAQLGAIRPLGDQTNTAQPLFNFGKSGAPGAVAPSHDHFQVRRKRPAVARTFLPLPDPDVPWMQAKKRSSELGDSIDNRNGGDSRFEDEDWDPTGPMEKASAAELANRKIVRRARRKKSAAPAVSQVKGLFSAVDNTAAQPAATTATSAPSFKFGAAAHQAVASAQAAAAPSFAFKINSSSDGTTAAEHKPKESTAAQPAFTFGTGAAAPAAFAFKTDAPVKSAAEGQAAPFAFKIDAPVKSAAAGQAAPFAFKIDAPVKSAAAEHTAPKFGFSFNLGPPAATSDATDEENEPEEQEQETGTIVAGAGEEAETTEREHKAKLYRLRDGEWVEQGMGQLKLNRDNTTGKRRLLMRAGLRVVLNTPLFDGQLVKVQGAGILFSAAEVVDGVQSTASFLLKVNKEQLQSLADAIAAGHSGASDTSSAVVSKQTNSTGSVAQQSCEQTKPDQSEQENDEVKPSAPEAAPKKPFAFKAPDAAAVMPPTSNQPVFTFGGPTKLVQPSEEEMNQQEDTAPKKPFVFKAPDAAAVMPPTSNQPVFTFGGPTKLVQPSEEEMDEQEEDSDSEDASDESYVEDEAHSEEGEEDDEEGEEDDEEADEEKEDAEEEMEETQGGEAATGLGAGLAMHVAEKVTASAVSAENAKPSALPDQSSYRAQLEDYQNALEDWVQIAQREEKHRRALEQQLANAAAGGVPVTPRKQQATDNAAAEVAKLQAQLAQVKADAEKKLGDLRTELETQQATVTRTAAEAEQLRQQNQAAQEEITKLKTPTKAVVPARNNDSDEADKIAALSQEVEILKKLFLASASASPAASEIQAQQQQQQQLSMPIPSPCKVLATPTPVRGSPHAMAGATKAHTNSQHMHALNKQIASWVNSSLASNPDADLTPQLKDYMNHVSGWQEVHNKWFRPSSN